MDDVTATPADVLKGKTAYTKDNDDPTTGTLQLAGNAQAAHVMAGETFYTTDPKAKQTGKMTVNSLLSFSCAPYSGRRVLAKWQNPNQAAGKPFSGVIIRYSTSGYPGKGGTQIYKGAGSNTAAGGWSQVYLDMPALNTTYYFSCCPYVTCSAGEMTGAVLNATVATGEVINKAFTAAGSYTIPTGYSKIDLFTVGGGGAGAAGGYAVNERGPGGGGGGGYTAKVLNYIVAPGMVINAIVGAGGMGTLPKDPHVAAAGGETYFLIGGTKVCAAQGGKGGQNGDQGNYGGNGGSGGGSASSDEGGSYGGSDGGSGGAGFRGGDGQGTITRKFGESGNTLYAGGGGGGANKANGSYTYYPAGAGGAGGGAAGGNNGKNGSGGSGNAGAPGTGGGGGGGQCGQNSYSDGGVGGPGGSGIACIRVH